ncbi:hypothetical protein AAAU17_01895, partial [Anthropogastromicrobium aceti]|uniref:hypothetical protein n=1 Tax=Anthropogastromicrobium aceti TaxID=2981768 RepID=UPI0032C0C1DC
GDNSGDNLGITLFGTAYFAGGTAYFAGGTAYFACVTAKYAVPLNKLLFFSYHYGILKPI